MGCFVQMSKFFFMFSYVWVYELHIGNEWPYASRAYGPLSTGWVEGPRAPLPLTAGCVLYSSPFPPQRLLCFPVPVEWLLMLAARSDGGMTVLLGVPYLPAPVRSSSQRWAMRTTWPIRPLQKGREANGGWGCEVTGASCERCRLGAWRWRDRS